MRILGMSLKSSGNSKNISNTIFLAQLLLVCSAERSEVPPLSATVWRGTPPPRPGGETSPRFFSGTRLNFTAVLLLYGTDDLSSGRKPRLLRSYRRSPLCRRLSAATCAPYSACGMDLGRGGDVVLRLRPRYIAAQRGTSAWSRRSGYGDTSRPRSLRARAGPTANSPGSGFQTSLFSCSCMSTWTPLKPGLSQASLCRYHSPSWLQQLGTTPTSTHGL
jgi:hypothetical protein